MALKHAMCLRCNRLFLHPHIPYMCPGCYSDTVEYPPVIVFVDEETGERYSEEEYYKLREMGVYK